MASEQADITKASASVQSFLSKLDVDMVGVARLDDLKGSKFGEQTLKLLPAARSIIILAMEIYPEFLELTSPERRMGTASLNDLFNRHIEYLRARLVEATHDIARVSRRAGLKALPLPARGPSVDSRFLEAVISYRHAAEAAGIGRVGLSGLTVTHEFGPRVQLALCLTEAALKSTANEDSGACRSCNVCILKCPSGALGWPKDGEPYVINKFACLSYMNASGGCSECMRQCPVASPKYT